MFATYLVAGFAVYAIAVMFALAMCKSAKRADQRMGIE